MTTTINASTTAGLVQTADTSGVLALQTAGTTAVTVDASQNVGIGTASPAGKLDVSQSTAGVARHYLRNTSDSVGAYTILDLVNNTGNNIGEFFCTSSTNTSAFGTNATVLQAATSNPLILGTNGTERMRINAGAPILCLLGGSTTATGTGIAFPATQSASADANTLDDYEEGTWTPVFAGNSPAGSATYSSQIGTYTKIGNMVNVRFQLVATSGITGGGGVTLIRGLPFNPGGSSQNGGGGSITIWSGFATGINTSNLYVDAGNNYLVPYYAGSFTATSGSYWGTTTVIQNTSSVAGVATYYV